MADKTVTAPEAPASEPPLSETESKQWADLAAEFEKPEGEDATEATPPERTEAEPKEPTEPADDKPKLTYEQLESNYRNAQGAFTSERERARRAEESLTAVNKLIDDLRAARAPPRQPEPEPPPIPDVNEDPIGHFQGKVAMLEHALAQTYQGAAATQEHLQSQHREQVFWDHVRASENEFRKTAPVLEFNGQKVSDYDLACEHLKAHRMGELQHLYPDNSPLAQQEARQQGLPTPAHLRAAILQSDAMGIAQRAYQLGVAPAQLYYEAAKTRGYTTPKGNGATPNGKIETAKRGQRAALTISGGEGRKVANDMTMSDLSDLYLEDPQEFDKQWDRMKRAGKLG
jgi:hypothetical protein